jgi:hypothetical protein
MLPLLRGHPHGTSLTAAASGQTLKAQTQRMKKRIGKLPGSSRRRRRLTARSSCGSSQT